MKKIALCLLAILSSISGYCQLSPDAQQKLNVRAIEVNQFNQFGISEDDLDNIQGSPYANREFLLGSIYEKDKMIQKNILLRYNSFSDEIEIAKSENASDYDALLKNPEVFVKILNSVYVFVPLKESKDNGGYFQIVEPGKTFDLYKKSITKYFPPVEAKTTYQVSQDDKFETIITYYLFSRDGRLIQLPTSRNKMIKAMSGHKNQVKKYIDSNRLDLKKEQDLKKLIGYYNSIL